MNDRFGNNTLVSSKLGPAEGSGQNENEPQKSLRNGKV